MSQSSALVTAAGGIGDILRITPLVRVFHALGYGVDVLVAPDYLDTVHLLDGAPEIRRLFYTPSAWCKDKEQRLDGLPEQSYDIATFTVWSSSLQTHVRARQRFAFQRQQWLLEGDQRCVEAIARAVGWTAALPAPFARAEKRDFGLPQGTIALHPGCKPGWPWKKWHGFESLARLLPSAAIIGTPADADNRDTYFRRSFTWPETTKDFVGKLSLSETASLIQECAALVSNDSGLMHLAVALGIPTFGIFGLTSPAREAMPVANMVAITKGLACEPACRRTPWGRRDCQYHLECLKTLTPEEVLKTVVGSGLPIIGIQQ